MNPIIIDSNQPILIRHQGIVKSIADWAKDPSANVRGLSFHGIAGRVATGLPLSEALTLPRNQGSGHYWDYKGQRLTLSDIVKHPDNIHQLSPNTIRYRLQSGLTVGEVLAASLHELKISCCAGLTKSPQNIHGLSESAIRYRINRGWTEDEALSRPRGYVAPMCYPEHHPLALVVSPKNIHGLGVATIRYRLGLGWDADTVLSTCRYPGGKKKAGLGLPTPSKIPETQLCHVYRLIKVGGRLFRSWWIGNGWGTSDDKAIATLREYRQIRKEHPQAISIFVNKKGVPVKD